MNNVGGLVIGALVALAFLLAVMMTGGKPKK